ncbi:LpxL/LpxP family Kdo(2)-lipid IV(A) lauroyl/palmitoleoyl acyltransferase [Aliiglaciecola sp. LCG003]|uniref:LpxL/LpxP family Kdo(2)-lipid IV(A) lauroyl/palmitoleoyl acyltransferase n=1 Tax=Aliiglaciecola sp. LCG003 TaxID=3053655 RepID=UPI0025730192|nr:LpxL/LpxP family Kdo(2)-lipid IV(A) lauroyl/palmitoleoyl acyltransferase [Aliiglaciecola sp. LCG003]WJG10429.1 LpxL/LpxP family Kdo(2)-lipid IV(A) lauroyl/palmitoleoyl acyltransferase [Aliiglaciecola sp. LCG003]
MSQSRVEAPPFKLSFLMPQYWPIWLSIGVLYFISWLPFKVQLYIGKGLGWILTKLAKKRVLVAKRNLELCFPEKSQQQITELLDANVEHAGMAILETSMGWWWPNWRVRALSEVEGYEHVQAILDKGKGVLGLAIHNMNLEMACRVAGLQHPSVAFYRKHNNPLMEYMQYRGRARSNKYMIHKRNVKGLIEALDQQEVCFYLPDQDYGKNRSEFVPFFAVPEVATTKGTLLFAKEANCETVFIVPLRTKDGYKVKYLPGLKSFPSGDDKLDIARINKAIEEMVEIAPEQYLWMHKRFKTRPNDSDPSLYD